MLAIEVGKSLLGVVSEVDESVVLLDFEFRGGGPKVPLLMHKYFILVGTDDPHPDVELPSLEQQRPLDILLDHSTGVFLLLTQHLPDFLEFVAHFDSFAFVESRRFH